MNKKSKKVVIVGLGYVGLPLAILAYRKGYQVKGIVRDQDKARDINKGICPFKDKELDKLLKKYPVFATTDFSVISEADIIISCVPTPITENNYPDFEPIITSSAKIGKYLKKGSLVILESTVNPGATETVMIPILEVTSHMKSGTDFYVSHCPERINPGDKIWDVEKIPRVVGSLNKTGLDLTLDYYRSILKGGVRAMKSIREAEAVKIVENCFRDVNIAFVNELAMSFANLGIDVMDVLEGAATKPFAFLKHLPGCGVGGHCIPVDPYYLIDYAGKMGFNHNFLALARKINNNMPQYTVDLLLKAAKKNGGINPHVAVLGLAYKADIGDTRESPAFDILKILEERKIPYDVYDPYVIGKSTKPNLEKVLEGKSAVIIATDHKEFSKITPQMLLDKKIKVVVDGRNCLAKDKFMEAGIIYQGIGR